MTRWLRLILGVGWLALMVWPRPGAAHGGGTPQLVAVPVGPYTLSLWTQPDPPRVGTLHLTAAVFVPGPQADTPVLDARVVARLTPEQGQPLEVELTHAQAVNPLYYEADVRVPSAGVWRVTIAVQGEQGGGEAAFDLKVHPALPLGGWGLAALAVVLLVGGYFLLGGKRS